jgi:RNA polymerase sigma-70 factor (ECF subfamily)
MHDEHTTHPMPTDPALTAGASDTDAPLVRRALDGDEQAFGRLVARYGSPILSLCFASTLDRSAAEELAQDVFVAAWRGLAGFRGDSAFSTWLFAIARNACVDRSRRRGRVPHTVPLDSRLEVASPPRDPDARRVLAAAAELSPQLREALLMREIQGLSYEEIAALQDVPVGTVRSRLSAARASVADRLGS